MLEEGSRTFIITDINNDGHPDYLESVDTTTKKMILKAKDINGDNILDILTDGSTGETVNLHTDSETNRTINDLGDQVLMKVNEIFNTILKKMKQNGGQKSTLEQSITI